jgi:UDP-2,3-diacylglucosamine pyrophosphatase LpxH
MNDFILSRFDELYVVSDIHMGGPPNFQILNQGPRLGTLIQHLATVRQGERVGLVLNGDVVDSLAEDIDGYVAMDEAPRMMERIYRDPAFAPIWDGLAAFVREPGRRLVIVLGNHDIEMMLPSVEASIRTRLAGDDTAAQGRITFATQGMGFACLVGRARVFCTHGNEVDAWNIVDYNALRELAISQNAGAPFDRTKWVPNAGTQLVKDVMNSVKRKYAWIDLLKPETQAALGTLVVLDPGQAVKIEQITSALSAYLNQIKGTLKLWGWLSAEDPKTASMAQPQPPTLPQLLGPNLLDAVQGPGSGTSTDPAEMLLQAERSLTDPTRRQPVVASTPETLGLPGMLWDRLRGVEPAEALRRALKDWLAKDHSFDITERDQTFRDVTSRVGAAVDFVVTGHTHLERALRIQDGVDRFYYNCGTWIRLLRFTDFVLDRPEAFREVYQTLADGKMDTLDRAMIPTASGAREPFVLDRTSVVRISSQPDGVNGTLCHVHDAGPGAVELAPVHGSDFWRQY